ncbi:hypothetical protein EDD21DRAFT_362468 [Dissophora ornata]|nr:hypothetical protein EDD21DRAFT_362468 [Dissophora ornata]
MRPPLSPGARITNFLRMPMKRRSLLFSRVMIRKKSDNLPPRSLPVAGSKKRSREDAEHPHGSSKPSKKIATAFMAPVTANGRERRQKKIVKAQQNANLNVAKQSTNQNDPGNVQPQNGRRARSGVNGPNKQPPLPPCNKPKQSQKQAASPLISRVSGSVPGQTNGNRDGGASESKESESSSSSSSSSSDTDSDSSSSQDDSSNTDSASDTDSSESPKPSKNVRRIIPGMGSAKTKARNARRKIAKEKTALVQTSQAGLQDVEAPSQKQSTLLAQEAEATSKSAAPTRPFKSSSGQITPKIVMTSVELRDTLWDTSSKRTAQLGQKNTNTPKVHARSAPTERDTPTTAKGNKAATNAALIDVRVEEDADFNASRWVYAELPKLEGLPSVGDMIAFKTLEMGPSYNPIISEFKEATVISFSEADMVAQVQLAGKFRTPIELDSDGRAILGKFDVYDEEEIERIRQGIVSLDWLTLEDCRALPKK